MADLSILEWSIIGFIIFAKFAIIIGVALWSKSNQEKKKQQFLAQEALRKAQKNAEAQSI